MLRKGNHFWYFSWGKIIARRTGDDAIDFDLSTVESIAQAAAAGLVAGILQTLLQRQADVLADPLACPACGLLCPLTYADRTVQVQAGIALPYHEPVGHCPDCRRDFSPCVHACALTATATPRPSSSRS